MTRYHIDSDAVFHATEQAQQTIARINTDLQQLTGSLQALQSSWSGQASMAFQAVFAEWRATQQAVETQLIAITHSLGQAATHYLEMEQANTRLFQR